MWTGLSEVVINLSLVVVVKRFLPARFHLHYDLQKEASDIWRTRLRQRRFSRVSQFYLLFLCLLSPGVWADSLMFSVANSPLEDDADPTLVSIRSLSKFIGKLASLGYLYSDFLVVALAVAVFYTFLLLEIQAQLPGWMALIVTAALATASCFVNIKEGLMLKAVWLFPEGLHGAYEATVEVVSPFVVGYMTLVGVLITVRGLRMRQEVFLGLYHSGEKYRESDAYLKWTKPQEPIPSLINVVRVHHKNIEISDTSGEVKDAIIDPDVVKMKPLSKSQRASRAGRRRRRRNAQRHNRKKRK